MRELKTQFANALLVVLTVAAILAAALNFQQQSRYLLPDDGVIWTDRSQDKRVAVEALSVTPGGPGDKAGLRPGDRILKINGGIVESATAVPQILLRLGSWIKAEYQIERRGIQAQATIYIGERMPEPAVYYQYVVGIAYLLIGVFVYLRRVNAPKARHFYILCLASFVLSTFHYTGKLNNFDRFIYWGNVAAGLYAPTIFLHFCLTFPEARKWLTRGRVWLLYTPATLLMAVFLGVASGTVHVKLPVVELRWLLDRTWVVAFCVTYMLGGVALALEYRRVEDTIVRQQLKWLRNGVVLGIVPFSAFYMLPYAMGVIPGPWMKMAVLSLPLMPLTWAYAIIRYRLMDVDVIFQQGYAYTLATLAVLGIFYSLVLSISKFDDLKPQHIVAIILVATFVFQPIRSWVQEVLDRYYFYRDRYDYRRTLIEFARELSSETDLDHMLGLVADRLIRTLNIQHVAFFLGRELEPAFELKMVAGNRPSTGSAVLDLSFLGAEPDKPYLFFERTKNTLDVISQDMPQSVRHSIATLDLTYYIPCLVRRKTIAYIGASRTDKGDFLSSDDLELIQTLAGYVGIAIENARLYRSLANKAEQFERLKEFSENIVESINVGILAADLDDRVESWNSQLEKLTGIERSEALGHRLCELLPAELCERLDQVRGESGVHHVVKFPLERRVARKSREKRNGAAQANGNGNGNGNGKSQAAESIVNLAVAPLISKDLQQIGRLVIFDDITDRSELERQLVQADKLSSIGLLAAGVAHEVNTPLAVISTYAQMLAKQVSGDETKAKLLEKIAKQTFRASEIVNSLLNFSRTSPTAFEEIDLNKLVRETCSLIQHQLLKAHVELRLDLQESLPSIRANSGKLQQVFLNLFLNARDAMEQGGRLAVRSFSDEGWVRIEVTDNGQGIAPEHVDRIYDPFFTTKGSRKGTGLGLAVSYGIVKEHGGSIEVKSQLGVGTQFLLEFPVVRKPVLSS